MNSVFDTTFEMSLRLVLLLSASGGDARTTDMLTLIDTIAIYGGEFGIAEANLHGKIDSILDELDTRRELIKLALKDLVLRGMVHISESHEGFSYMISENGAAFTEKLTSAYANEYRSLVSAANALADSKTEREVFSMIRETCDSMMERGLGNG